MKEAVYVEPCVIEWLGIRSQPALVNATFASEGPAAPLVGVYFDKAVEGGMAAMRILSALDRTIDFDGIEAASPSGRRVILAMTT